MDTGNPCGLVCLLWVCVVCVLVALVIEWLFG